MISNKQENSSSGTKQENIDNKLDLLSTSLNVDIDFINSRVSNLENKPSVQSGLSAESTKHLLENMLDMPKKVADLDDRNKPKVVNIGGSKFTNQKMLFLGYIQTFP